MLYLLSTSCVLTLAYSTLFLLFSLGDTLLLFSSCWREGVHPELPGVRGLLGDCLPVDVPVVPSFDESLRICFYASAVSDIFVIHVINNIRTRFIISFYVICAVIYCSFCCIYVWLDPGTYMIARFMFFYKPGVTCSQSANLEPHSLCYTCWVQVVYSLLHLLYFFLLVTLLLLSSCRHEGVRPALPGLRGLLGVRLPVDVPVAPCSASESFIVFVLRFRCIRHFCH